MISNDYTTAMQLEFLYNGNYSFVGDNSKLVVGGEVTFDNFLFNIDPGTSDNFIIWAWIDDVVSHNISAAFWFCNPGEMDLGTSC